MLLKFDTEKDWLEARKQDITSTEIAALFGVHPFKSKLRLWHEKAGILEPEFEESNFSTWGRRLQIPVGKGICEDMCWEGFDLTGYYFRDEKRRSGCSLDMKVVCPERGVGDMEIKIAEAFREEDGWTKEKAPLHYELQLQSQMHEALKHGEPFEWGCIATLGRRQTVRIYFRDYDIELGRLFDDEIEKFWESIETNTPPKPNYAVDSGLLARLAKPVRAGESKNLSENNRAVDLIQTYAIHKETAKIQREALEGTQDLMQQIKAEIHEIMGNAETAIIGDYIVGAREQVVEEFYHSGYTTRRFDVKKRKK